MGKSDSMRKGMGTGTRANLLPSPAIANRGVLVVLQSMVIAGVGWIALGSRSVPPPTTKPNRPTAALSIDLNTATVRELMLVPGIGKTTAQEIVDERNRGGRFQTIQDVARVNGVGEKTLLTLGQFCAVHPETNPAVDKRIANR